MGVVFDEVSAEIVTPVEAGTEEVAGPVQSADQAQNFFAMSEEAKRRLLRVHAD